MNCPICGKNEYKYYEYLDTICQVNLFGKILGINDLKFYICNNCKTGVLFPVPTDVQLSNYYKIFFDDVANMIRNRDSTLFEKNRLKTIKKYILKYGLRKNILEIGTNIGVFLNICEKDGFIVTGIEPSNRAIEYAKKKYNLEIKNGGFELLENINKKYDVITANHVFEHVNDPQKFIKLCYNSLVTGGLIHIGVPNEIYTIDNLPIWRKIIKKIIPQKRPTDHLYFYNINSLKKIFRDNGFDIIEIITNKGLLGYMNYPFPIFLKDKPGYYKYILLIITFLYSIIAKITRSGDLIDLYAIKR